MNLAFEPILSECGGISQNSRRGSSLSWRTPKTIWEFESLEVSSSKDRARKAKAVYFNFIFAASLVGWEGRVTHLCHYKRCKTPLNPENVWYHVTAAPRDHTGFLCIFFCKLTNFNWHMLTLPPTPALKYSSHLNTPVPIHEQIWAHADSTILPCFPGKCVQNTIITTAIWAELDRIRALIGLLK